MFFLILLAVAFRIISDKISTILAHGHSLRYSSRLDLYFVHNSAWNVDQKLAIN